jgi:eukaryotic-like serine/threonine-protein kinase
MTPERWQEVERLYQLAAAREVSQRATFLEEACHGDEAMRQEIDSLLAHEEPANHFMEAPGMAVLAQAVAQDRAYSMIGRQLGAYQILSLLGAGGMGEVYQARDTRLGRLVALKILPPGVATDPERKRRFLQEAKVVSALNHPHIVTLHDVGSEDGIDFLVMEYVPGKTLDKLIPRKGLALREALQYAIEIAGALAKAHAAGIIHRDLKPGNIMVTDGVLKVLDFGLAKLMEAAEPSDSSATTPLTSATMIVGTAAYMSPEQARGRPVDTRSDIFSFGVMLYEMLTSRRPFEAADRLSTLAAILEHEPTPLTEMDAKIPHELERVVQRCLRKDPDRRFQGMADVKVALEELKDEVGSGGSVSREPVKSVTSRTRIWKWIAIPACVLVAATIVALLKRDIGQDLSHYRYTPFAMNRERQFVPKWSPDGRAIAYLGLVNGHQQVFVRYLDSPVSTQLTANREYAQPTRWSPDGKRILFIAPRPDSTEAKPKEALYSIAVVGGEPEQITPVPDYEVCAEEVSPDNQTMAIAARPEGGKARVFISSPIGSPFRQYEPAPFACELFYGVTSLRFAPNGKKLLLIRTDSDKEEAWLLPYPPGKSAPHRILTHFPAERATSDFSWMPDNRHVILALAATRYSQDSHLWMADTESEDSYQITSGIGTQGTVAVSPDGKQIIYSEEKEDLDVTTVSVLDGKSKKVIATDISERMAAWSANTDKLAYVTDRNGPMEIWMRSGDGSDHPLITQKDFPGNPTRFLMNPSLSPDGKRMIFTRCSDEGTIRTWIMSLSGGPPERLNESANDSEWAGTWSPDGRRFAELANSGSNTSLTLIKVGSREKPVILRDHGSGSLPDWSSTDAWLTFEDKSGWNLISPDGKTVKPLGKIATSYLAFSKDGNRLYGIREEHDKTTLFSLDIGTLKVTDIHELGKDLAPVSDYSPGIRFTLTRDGKSITYTTMVAKSNLWLLEGFRQPGLLSRLGLNWSR